ncbi:hypothetical protein EJB05_43714, partial [Eragrostis curvula]
MPRGARYARHRPNPRRSANFISQPTHRPCVAPLPPLQLLPMASITGSAVSFARPVKALNINSVSFSGLRKDNVAFPLQTAPQRFAVCCYAKKETVDKVCDIVKKQLALADEQEVCAASKFQDLGADSLDTVEIVMGLEEAFGISVEESSAQSIATVEDAANLIDDLVAAGKS